MVNSKNILVTGGAGFIGSAFVAQIVKMGHNVIVLDALTYAGHIENLKWIGEDKFKLIVGSICDGELVLEILEDNQIDYVVNFAAESHVDNSINTPYVFVETNVIGTHVMLEACRNYIKRMPGENRLGFRYLQVSTDEVYGALKIDDDEVFTEKSPMRPNSPYSATKAAADHLVRAWHKTYGLPTIITNCSNNYGPRQYPEKLIPRMIKRALTGQTLTVHGDGLSVRDWIHVEDHCQGVYLALTKGRPGETYCLGGHSEKTNIYVIERICDILDQLVPLKDGKSYKEQITFVEDRPGQDRRYAIDDSKAKKELRFKHKFNFDSSMEETVKWYLDNQEWINTVTEKLEHDKRELKKIIRASWLV